MAITNSQSMTSMVDDLTEYFANSTVLSLHNPSQYRLYLNNGGLYTADAITTEQIIGEIRGSPCYIWEINHNEYIIMDDELVVDIRNHKTNIMSYVREENMTNHPSNCYIRMFVQLNGHTQFFLISKAIIMPDQELVYNAFDFAHD